MPLPKISIEHVSPDYFRNGLAAVKEAGAPQQAPAAALDPADPAPDDADPAVANGANAEGKVLDAADWLDAHDQPLGRGQIRTPRANGRQVALDHAWSDKTHFLVCPSYFTSDYFDRLFG